MKKNNIKKAGIALFVMWMLTQMAFARLMAINDGDFQILSQKSDLIVIAHVLESSKTTPEEATLTNIGPAIKVLGIETKFLPEIILKGDPTNRFVIVHHYRLPDSAPLYRSGPMLVSFTASTYKNYLLFLKREADGRYAPAGGQTDVAISIRRIADSSETPNELLHRGKNEDEMEHQWQQIKGSADAPLTVEFVKMEAVDEIRKRGDLKITNKTAKAVNRCSLQLFFFNQSGKLFEINSMGVGSAVGENLVGANGEFFVQARGNTDNYETSHIEAVVTSVEFADGTKWNVSVAH
jgi:hypothetical protein